MNAGIKSAGFNPVAETTPDSDCRLQEIPDFAALEFISTDFDTTKALAIAKANGVINPQFYKWQNHVVLYAKLNHAEKLRETFATAFPAIQIRLYTLPVYNFSRAEQCRNAQIAQEWEHVLLTANLVDDPKLQQEYLNYHKTQFEKWPEVSAGFCNAGFQQLQVFKNGRQLLLVISIPKGASLADLNPKTTENNPRVNDWNGLMKKYQTGIDGAKPDETWVELKKINQQ
ncbi:MAG TPA: L-rhamnose mutarotase [Paludibacter sp.]|nr:L-rhamnose mutarotase [Paludibacter sp.]